MVMALHTKRLDLPSGLDRAEIRRFVINVFLDELPGDINESQRYEYIVEECKNRDIIIARQTQLNKGMDFRIQFRDIYFQGRTRRTRSPSHQHIVEDLIEKKNYDEAAYALLAEKIISIYNCENDSQITEDLRSLDLPVGYLLPEEVCLTLKWLFIEQDITYWGYSGRAKLYNYLVSCELL